ncbi:MAG TPA: hypothetical protein VKY74_12000, partial [Chloroflexia bacterium]|nr:hypothetical protein [Chloroflexia bacterium]
ASPPAVADSAPSGDTGSLAPAPPALAGSSASAEGGPSVVQVAYLPTPGIVPAQPLIGSSGTLGAGAAPGAGPLWALPLTYLAAELNRDLVGPPALLARPAHDWTGELRPAEDRPLPTVAPAAPAVAEVAPLEMPLAAAIRPPPAPAESWGEDDLPAPAASAPRRGLVGRLLDRVAATLPLPEPLRRAIEALAIGPAAGAPSDAPAAPPLAASTVFTADAPLVVPAELAPAAADGPTPGAARPTPVAAEPTGPLAESAPAGLPLVAPELILPAGPATDAPVAASSSPAATGPDAPPLPAPPPVPVRGARGPAEVLGALVSRLLGTREPPAPAAGEGPAPLSMPLARPGGPPRAGDESVGGAERLAGPEWLTPALPIQRTVAAPPAPSAAAAPAAPAPAAGPAFAPPAPLAPAPGASYAEAAARLDSLPVPVPAAPAVADPLMGAELPALAERPPVPPGVVLPWAESGAAPALPDAGPEETAGAESWIDLADVAGVADYVVRSHSPLVPRAPLGAAAQAGLWSQIWGSLAPARPLDQSFYEDVGATPAAPAAGGWSGAGAAPYFVARPAPPAAVDAVVDAGPAWAPGPVGAAGYSGGAAPGPAAYGPRASVDAPARPGAFYGPGPAPASPAAASPPDYTAAPPALGYTPGPAFPAGGRVESLAGSLLRLAGLRPALIMRTFAQMTPSLAASMRAFAALTPDLGEEAMALGDLTQVIGPDLDTPAAPMPLAAPYAHFVVPSDADAGPDLAALGLAPESEPAGERSLGAGPSPAGLAFPAAWTYAWSAPIDSAGPPAGPSRPAGPRSPWALAPSPAAAAPWPGGPGGPDLTYSWSAEGDEGAPDAETTAWADVVAAAVHSSALTPALALAGTEVAPVEAPTLHEDPPAGGADLDSLADSVYDLIRRRLEIEHERNRA